MFNKLIEQYVQRMNYNDIINFSNKNGISLKQNEIELIYNYIKNDWKTIVYGNPRGILDELKNNVDNITYNKIENLYYQLKNKYIDYL